MSHTDHILIERQRHSVVLMAERRNAYRLLVRKSEGDHWEDQDVDGWITLRWIL
jgi:hypothetical protein